ncbi:MAG: hypothetical protein GTO17_11255 [Candidatus Aminicenantes bacterium]|nr:hypothetical protein [Candidatus Aminicenantes bacterium]
MLLTADHLFDSFFLGEVSVAVLIFHHLALMATGVALGFIDFTQGLEKAIEKIDYID